MRYRGSTTRYGGSVTRYRGFVTRYRGSVTRKTKRVLTPRAAIYEFVLFAIEVLLTMSLLFVCVTVKPTMHCVKRYLGQ